MVKAEDCGSSTRGFESHRSPSVVTRLVIYRINSAGLKSKQRVERSQIIGYAKKHIVKLTQEQHQQLLEIVKNVKQRRE